MKSAMNFSPKNMRFQRRGNPGGFVFGTNPTKSQIAPEFYGPYHRAMPTPQLRTARERMVAANKAIRDYTRTEPYSDEIARILLADAIKATEEYVSLYEQYVASKASTDPSKQN